MELTPSIRQSKILVIVGLLSFAAAGYHVALFFRSISSSSDAVASAIPSLINMDDDVPAPPWNMPWFQFSRDSEELRDVPRDSEIQSSTNVIVSDRVSKNTSEVPDIISDDEAAASLDNLVAASIERQDNMGIPRRGVAFVKSHKCGSSTLGSIMFRYAARHRQRMPHVHHNIAAKFELKNNVTKCKIALQHIHASKWKDAFAWYTQAIDNPVFVTILREPISHYASWAHFYKLPETKVSGEYLEGVRQNRTMTLDEFVMSSNARKSPLAHSLGLYRTEHLDSFIDAFSLILLLERLDEGLILLKRLLGWDLIDLTHFKINDSHHGRVRSSQAISASDGLTVKSSPREHHLRRSWDGLAVTPTPRISSLKLATSNRIIELTAGLDIPLYNRAANNFDERVIRAGDTLRQEVASLQQLQIHIAALCSDNVILSLKTIHQNTWPRFSVGTDEHVFEVALTRPDFADLSSWNSHLAHGWKRAIKDPAPKSWWACRWYRLSDLEYEKQIQPSGLAPPVPFLSRNPPVLR